MLITLTTDLGTTDYYAGMVKGEIMRALPDATIIDISHSIKPFDIFHGAFVLKNCYRNFPAATVHLIGVNMNERGADTLIALHNSYTFIGPDNGFFGLLFDGEPVKPLYRMAKNAANTLPLKDDYVSVLSAINANRDLTTLAELVTSYRQSSLLQPQVSSNAIRAAVIYVDRFENAMVNITKDVFEKVRNGRSYSFYFKKYEDVNEVAENYSGVAEGDKLCLFNAAGYLEIAMNKGNAAGLLHLEYGDAVQIEFH